MTSPAPPKSRRYSAGKVLAVFAVIAIIVALLTPEAQTSSSGDRSTFSTAPGGARMAFELARKLGWQTERRMAPLDSLTTPAVNVVIAPSQALGAHQVHRLLDDVRRGGGLVFTLDGGDEIADSIGVGQGPRGQFLTGFSDSACPPPSFQERASLAVPPEVRKIVWFHRAPGPTVTLARVTGPKNEEFPVVVGFPMGRGRVAVVTSSGIFANEAVRVCNWGADIGVVRAFEYVRPRDVTRPRLVFDEYSHGYGAHAGSIHAISAYLAGTPSGHFLTQALLAGLLLVFARAPRALPPRDPARVARRSPLEHVDALGHAYADVAATRTATARLLSGVRRRAERTSVRGGAVDDQAFLDSVRTRFPTISDSVEVVRDALRRPVATRELAAVGTALETIEHHLLTTPPHSS